MDWRPYGPCCQRHAADTDAVFCPECGHPYLRCLAFEECKGLVEPMKECAACVKPVLLIGAGAMVQSKKGDRISVPLILRNGSTAGRPIWVTRIARLDDASDVPLRLTWEQIEAGAERRFSLDTPPLADGGSYTFRVMLVVSSQYRGIDESYAFEAGISLSASSQDSQNVTTNITVAGNVEGTGHLFSAQGAMKSGQASGDPAERAELPLQRAERYELDNGVRGYKTDHLRVPRNVDLTFTGFKPADVPPNGETLALRGRMICGRNSRTPDPSAQATPSDVCLRAYDSRTGSIDEPATLAISRHHFDVVVANDRLYVQAKAPGGIELNGELVPSGTVAELRPGDRLVPIPGRPEKLALQVAFVKSRNSVEKINLTRTPGTK